METLSAQRTSDIPKRGHPVLPVPRKQWNNKHTGTSPRHDGDSKPLWKPCWQEAQAQRPLGKGCRGCLEPRRTATAQPHWGLPLPISELGALAVPVIAGKEHGVLMRAWDMEEGFCVGQTPQCHATLLGGGAATLKLHAVTTQGPCFSAGQNVLKWH